MHARHRISLKLRKRVPVHVAPHDLEKHVRLTPLTPVENAVKDSHLRPVPCKPVALPMPHALLDFNAYEVQPEPVCMTLDLLPTRLILRRRVPSPGAPPVSRPRKHRVSYTRGN